MTDPRTGISWRLGDKFHEVYPHLESIDALWNKKWKTQAERGIHPFHDGKYEDFAPIFETLIRKGIHDGYSDEYTKEFIPTADELAKKADELMESGKKEEAIAMNLRAAALYRIGRFPYINSEIKRSVFEAQKRAFMKAATLWDCPLQEVMIQHTAGNEKDGKEIPVYVRIPDSASTASPCPVVVIMCGLDGYRPDNYPRSHILSSMGWATILVDIPGTADCPADRRDPCSPDRLLTSILDWMEGGVINMKKVFCWGVSAGGYDGVRAAHTHATRLTGAVGQGAGTHHFFSRAWLEKAAGHEYFWDGLPALAEKYGYDTVDELLGNAQADFSLLESGIVHQPSCNLLLVNGTHDGLMPIEDSLLMMEYGSPKEGRFFTGMLHMGGPQAYECVYPWLAQTAKGVQ